MQPAKCSGHQTIIVMGLAIGLAVSCTLKLATSSQDYTRNDCVKGKPDPRALPGTLCASTYFNSTYIIQALTIIILDHASYWPVWFYTCRRHKFLPTLDHQWIYCLGTARRWSKPVSFTHKTSNLIKKSYQLTTDKKISHKRDWITFTLANSSNGLCPRLHISYITAP